MPLSNHLRNATRRRLLRWMVSQLHSEANCYCSQSANGSTRPPALCGGDFAGTTASWHETGEAPLTAAVVHIKLQVCSEQAGCRLTTAQTSDFTYPHMPN